jgi:1-acyl-sn-glycerol-3-phosphate acyltransferase
MFYSFIRALFYLPIKLFYPTKIVGKEHLIKGKSILICNHKSNLDAVILGVYLKQKVHFLGKAELFKNKLSRWFFKKMLVISVNRGQADLKAVKEVLTVLKNNQTVGIFPAGTRTEEFEQEEHKNGAAMFALKTNAPIIPMLFHKKPKLFRKNTLLIGAPFYLKQEQKEPLTKENLQQYTNVITQKQQELLK